ncbi:MAG: exo-alpha-sialidase, partial [Acidobacteria bacterium]
MERSELFRFLRGTAVLLLPLWALAAPSASAQSIAAGANVNIVGGPASVTPGPPFRMEGDPYLQRQNEPSMACSSRNPLNCLAAANDYRLVNVPGLPDGRVTGDAWMGVYWSRDAGASWRSSVLPGFPQDTSPEGAASPLKGLEAAADPTVRAGTNGLFYLSGIAFNRTGETSSGPQAKSGVLFVSTLIDDNNTQRADTPMRYIRTVVVDRGTSGQFLDKPWIAVDIPRAGAGTCTIPGAGGVPDQVVPAGPVYVAYVNFPGSGNNPHSRLMFTRSTNCGVTWSQPTMLDESFAISQSAFISINPSNGGILVAWRQFGTSNLSDPGRILVATSSDFGRTFTSGREVASLGLANASVAYDQATLPSALEPGYRMFRTNGYPTACTDATGVHRIAWSQRGIGPGGDARVVVSTSTNAVTWSAPQPVDNHEWRGHQLMPSMACTASGVGLAWYDQRYDNAAIVFGPAIFGPFIVDPIPPPPAHTLDVRASVTGATGAFAPSIQVSRYQHAFNTATGGLVQLEFNPVNWPLFAGGTAPFIGDYIDLVPARVFRPPLGGAGWSYDVAS